MKKILLYGLLSIVSQWCVAQYSDEALYAAYMKKDMSVWQAYIDQTDWSKIDTAEKLRLVNYEYGFIANCIQANNPKSEEYLSAFHTHLEELQELGQITEARYYMYLSSVYAYDLMLNRGKLLSSGVKSFKSIKKAYKLAPNDPLVLTLKANVDFYAPPAIGGDKESALKDFILAKQLLEQEGKYQYLWNYAALRLCIAQCYEKTGEVQKAIDECYDILKVMPQFSYVKDEYLPTLLNPKKKK